MPFCTRDVGMFFGMLIGSAFGASYRRSIKISVLFLLLVPMALDGGLQTLTSYESTNILRVITGLIGGFGIGAYVNGSVVYVVKLLLFRWQKGGPAQ